MQTYGASRSGVRMNNAIYRDHGIRWWTWGRDEKVSSAEHGLPPSYEVDKAHVYVFTRNVLSYRRILPMIN